MTRKEQNKILNDKIESNNNQYKIDRLNAEMSAFSRSFLTRKDLKYKPNALDKARFEFSPLGKAFSTGLDKTVQGYQEEGVIKLLKDIRDSLRVGVNMSNNDNNDDNNGDNNDNYGDNDDNNDNDDNIDDNNDDKIAEEKKYVDMPDLETEEPAKRTEDFYEQEKDNYHDLIKNLKDKILDLETKLKDSELSNEEKDKLNNEEKGEI